MKIGVVCYPTYGGSGVVATELGQALAKKNHQVHFITYKRPARLGVFQENIYLHEVSSFEYPLFEYTPYETALASKMVDVVMYEKLDLLHVHYAIPHAAVAYMAKQILKTKGIDIPVVTTLHGTDITLVGKDECFAPVVEFSINNSDGVTAVSQSLKEETLATFNINKEINVIYNFIDFNRFKKTNKGHFRRAIANDNEKIIVHTSNFRKVKRVDDVIRVFEKIQKKIPSKLLLIGDGPERGHLEALTRSLKLEHSVKFLGKQEMVEEILAIADLFLIPSAKESFGLAALEAMACEVPVISSDAGGLHEVNIHNETGFICKIGDVDTMANYSLLLLENEEMLQKFRKHAYKRAKFFEMDHIVNQYEDLYKSVLSKVSI
jgi:N-acetyl-alpha-D-glucosaminyl L-malate synthase BshA